MPTRDKSGIRAWRQLSGKSSGPRDAVQIRVGREQEDSLGRESFMIMSLETAARP